MVDICVTIQDIAHPHLLCHILAATCSDLHYNLCHRLFITFALQHAYLTCLNAYGELSIGGRS